MTSKSLSSAADKTANEEPEAPSSLKSGLLTAGGLAAAFGAAACCALPMLLATFGIGSAWLAGIAYYTAPHEAWLLPVSVVMLAVGAIVMIWQQRQARRCAVSAPCTPAWVKYTNMGALALGAALVWIGYTYG